MVVGKEIQVRIVYTIWNCPKYIFMLSCYWVRQLLVAWTLFSECLWVCVGKNLTISSSVSWLCNFYLSCQRHAICSFPWECLSLAVGNWAGNFNYEKIVLIGDWLLVSLSTIELRNLWFQLKIHCLTKQAWCLMLHYDRKWRATFWLMWLHFSKPDLQELESSLLFTG